MPLERRKTSTSQFSGISRLTNLQILPTTCSALWSEMDCPRSASLAHVCPRSPKIAIHLVPMMAARRYMCNYTRKMLHLKQDAGLKEIRKVDHAIIMSGAKH